MQEDLAKAIEQTLGETLRRKTEELVEELSAQMQETCRQAADAARAEASAGAGTDFANTLAEAVRAIRAEESVTGIAAALVDGASKFSGRSLLFIHRGDQLLGFRAAGRVSAQQQDVFQKLSTSVGDAPAIARSIETLSAVETGGDALPSDLTGLLGLTENDRVHLFPVALRDKVLAVLASDARAVEADAEPVAVNTAAIGTLVALAEAWIEAVGTRRKQSAA